MSDPKTGTPNMGMLIAGCFVFGISIGGWLYASVSHIDATPILGFAIPIVGALFVGNSLGKAADNAAQAAAQTNGALDSRIKAAVSSALADRDFARTRQQHGDIGQLDQTGKGNDNG